MSQKYTLLPYLNPPESDITFINGRLVKISKRDCDEKQKETKVYMQDNGMTLYDFNRLALARQGIFMTKSEYHNNYEGPGKKNSTAIDFTNLDWALLILDDSNTIPINCYYALFDLFTGAWRSRLNDLDDNIFSLSDIKDGAKLADWVSFMTNSKNKRLKIALSSFYSAYVIEKDISKKILDCCQSLEAIFAIDNELRLKLSLYVFYYIDLNDKKILRDVYEMYGLRSSYIHGSRDIGESDYIDYIRIVGRVLEHLFDELALPNRAYLDKAIGVKL